MEFFRLPHINELLHTELEQLRFPEVATVVTTLVYRSHFKAAGGRQWGSGGPYPIQKYRSVMEDAVGVSTIARRPF